jgi:predicted double-glycine peptidase
MEKCITRRNFSVGAAAGAVLVGLCRGRAASGREVLSLAELRHRRVVLQEFDISCAAAALATILNYQHGERLTEREVALELIDRPEYIEQPDLVQIRQGFSLLDMKRFADGRGYEGIGLGQMEYEDLPPRAPLIVPIRVYGYNHFVVYRGELGNNVMLADPAYGNRTMSRDRFHRMWIDFPELGRVGFIVARRDGLIPPNRLTPTPEEFLVLRS